MSHVRWRVDVGMREEQLGIGGRLGLGGGDAGAQQVLRLLAHRLAALVVEHADAPQERLVLADALARALLLDAHGSMYARGSSAVACGAAR